MEQDRQYALKLLVQLNALTRDGTLIGDCFQQDGYSGWAFQQFFLFDQLQTFSAIRDLDRYRAFRSPRHGILSWVGLRALDVFLVFATGIEMLAARLQRPEVMLFSSDFLDANALPHPRMRNIHTYLADRHVPYTEIMHLTTVRSLFKNIGKRRRLGIYLEAFVSLARLRHVIGGRSAAERFVAKVDLNGFGGAEREFVRLILIEAVERVRISRTSASLVRAFFRFIGVRCYVSVDDFRFIPELLLACEEVGIPSYVFQHSNFGYLTGVFSLPAHMYIFPTVFFTWNAYWLKRIPEISPFFAHYAGRIRIGGRSYTPAAPVYAPRALAPDKKSLSVLVPYEVSVRKDQVDSYMDALLADTRITVLFLLRGTVEQIDYAMQLDKYFRPEHRASPRLVVIEPAGRAEALRTCDAVAGVYSGFLDESIESGVPVCVFATNFPVVNRLDEDGLATLVDRARGDLYNQLLQAYRTPAAVLEERRERVTVGTGDIRAILDSLIRIPT